MELNTEVIKELIGSLGKENFDTLKLETADFKLTIERGQCASSPCASAETVKVSTASQTVESTVPKNENNEKSFKGTVVKSPIVGTFYTAPSPDKPAFAEVGKNVKRGDTLYIVESMKLMNEVASECDGTVAEIFVKNGQAVEYGQPIMRIE
jgi:acetyl-CoA carboxylase biotin carboxyl carrier protein